MHGRIPTLAVLLCLALAGCFSPAGNSMRPTFPFEEHIGRAVPVVVVEIQTELDEDAAASWPAHQPTSGYWSLPWHFDTPNRTLLFTYTSILWESCGSAGLVLFTHETRGPSYRVRIPQVSFHLPQNTADYDGLDARLSVRAISDQGFSMFFPGQLDLLDEYLTPLGENETIHLQGFQDTMLRTSIGHHQMVRTPATHTIHAVSKGIWNVTVSEDFLTGESRHWLEEDFLRETHGGYTLCTVWQAA